MAIEEIELSQSFKKQTTKAIFAIALFFITYLILLAIAAALTAGAVLVGIKMIVTIPRFLTIVLGAGMISMGGLILIFLIKFIFTSNKTDRSHLTEVKKEDEPELFALIEEVVNAVGTKKPKKVYLMMEVNAGVFFDSSFLSMFFPAQKNLQIGLGLVNGVTRSELKGILAHEFGHFSQRSMKVGSYVYHTNQVIFNMLYHNDGFNQFMGNLASFDGIISFFVMLASKVMQGIQWILRQQYSFLNRTYMALSREMEFHADEIAGNVTGLEPIKSSLLRTSMVDYAFNFTLGFFEQRISKNIKTANIYTAQKHIISHLGKVDKMECINGFPQVREEDLARFNKSKLNIEQQWASHPSEQDRIKALEAKKLYAKTMDYQPASSYFTNFDATCEQMTLFIFKEVKYEGEINWMDFDTFKETYEKEHADSLLSEIYNHYFTSKDIFFFDATDPELKAIESKTEELFSNKMVDKAYDLLALGQDIEAVKQIGNKEILVRSFDYDGKKYRRRHYAKLLTEMEKTKEQLSAALLENDKRVFQHFLAIEQNLGKTGLREKYVDFLDYDKETEKRLELASRIQMRMQFVGEETEIMHINSNLQDVRKIEREVKRYIPELLENPLLQEDINPDMRENLETYLSKDHDYFGRANYFETKLEMLYAAINNYSFLTSRLYFMKKKDLLDYQASLLSVESKVEEPVLI